jgi:hypothetical protein
VGALRLYLAAVLALCLGYAAFVVTMFYLVTKP